MIFVKRINRYIAKTFLVKFLQITCGFSLLIFLINLLEALDKIRDSGASFLVAALMSFLKSPDFLNEVAPSLILISSILTFFFLSSRSEITIARASGFSLWHILKPIAISSFLLGIFWITVFGPISMKMSNKFNSLESEYVLREKRDMVAPSNGIWLKQINVEKPDEEIIIQAKKIYKDTTEFSNVTLWFFDNKSHFYKKIDAKNMSLQGNKWLLEDIIFNDFSHLNTTAKKLEVATNLDPEFINQTVISNFQNAKLFSIFQIPELIKDLRSAGFSSTKFEVYFHSLLSKPLLFVAMTLISCYFGINHVRNNKSIFMMFLGIIFGLIIYITSGIINALGSSSLIPVFASTWTISIICISIGILLIYRKEKI